MNCKCGCHIVDCWANSFLTKSFLDNNGRYLDSVNDIIINLIGQECFDNICMDIKQARNKAELVNDENGNNEANYTDYLTNSILADKQFIRWYTLQVEWFYLCDTPCGQINCDELIGQVGERKGYEIQQKDIERMANLRESQIKELTPKVIELLQTLDCFPKSQCKNGCCHKCKCPKKEQKKMKFGVI